MIRILFCKSSKTKEADDIFAKEFFLLSSNLKRGKEEEQFDIKVMDDNPTAGDFLNTLIRHNPNILHFSGEIFIDDNNIKGIYFKGRTGNIVVMDTRKWDAFFDGLKRMGDIVISSVVLSIFECDKIAQVISRYGVYCIAFSKKFDVNLRIPFISGFYFALAEEYPIEKAFEIGKMNWLCEFSGEGNLDLKREMNTSFALFHNGMKLK